MSTGPRAPGASQPRPAWPQVPALPDGSSGVPLLVPFLVTAVPLVPQLSRQLYEPRWIAAIVALGAVVVLVVDRARRAIPLAWAGVTAVVTAFVAVVLEPAVAVPVSVLLVVPATLWTLILRPDEDRGRVPGRLVLMPAAVPLVVTAILLRASSGYRLPLLAVGVAVALAALAAVRPGVLEPAMERIARPARRIHDRMLLPAQAWLSSAGGAVGRVLAVLVMLPAAALVMLTWVGHRVVRYDPLRPSGRGRGSAWMTRAGVDPNPSRLFGQAGMRGDRRLAVSLQRLGATIVSLVLVAIVAVPVVGGREGTDALRRFATNGSFDEPCNIPADEAMRLDPGWPETACEIMEFERNGRFDPTTTYTMADYHGEHVNVTDGLRRTWKAPKDCGCRRVRMVMFGGSAAFGWWQRDDFTIASELAKRFWQRDRIALDIELRAMPGWVTGQEVRKFAELTVTEPVQPDFALFYDGGNDLNRQKDRNGVGRGADESETVYAEDVVDKLLAEGPFPWVEEEFDPRPVDRRDPNQSPRQIGRHALDRYLRNLELARRMAAAADVEPIFVWQPLSPSAPAAVRVRGSLPPKEGQIWRGMLGEVLPKLPDDVLDYSDSLDEARRVVFKDVWHTNEYGSRLVAQQLHRDLRARVRAVAEGS